MIQSKLKIDDYTVLTQERQNFHSIKNKVLMYRNLYIDFVKEKNHQQRSVKKYKLRLLTFSFNVVSSSYFRYICTLKLAPDIRLDELLLVLEFCQLKYRFAQLLLQLESQLVVWRKI